MPPLDRFEREARAYLAALLDERADFRIRSIRGGAPYLEIRLRGLHPETVSHLMGSDFRPMARARGKDPHREVYYSGRDAGEVCEKLLPLLHASRERAEKVVEFAKTIGPRGRRLGPSVLRERRAIQKRLSAIA